MTTHYELASCPLCGGPDEHTVASREQVQREMEELWEFHASRLRPGTPPGRLADRVFFSHAPALRIGRCGHCGLLFRNPRERTRDLLAGYAEEEPDTDVLEALLRTQAVVYRTQARRLTRLAGGAGEGLEVGSYVGAFLSAARERGWRFEGLDVNPAMVRFTCGRGLAAREGTLEDLPEGRSFRAVAIWNTFEQLPDPRRAAAAARERLVPNGIFAVRVPNGGYYRTVRRLMDGPLRRPARAVLAHNNLLGFPYRHGFTSRTLRRLLEEAGFEVLHAVGDPLVPIADEWTRPWAVAEERLLKAALRLTPRGLPAPWLEMYARRR